MLKILIKISRVDGKYEDFVEIEVSGWNQEDQEFLRGWRWVLMSTFCEGDPRTLNNTDEGRNLLINWRKIHKI